jgi:hypothetical protein
MHKHHAKKQLLKQSIIIYAISLGPGDSATCQFYMPIQSTNVDQTAISTLQLFNYLYLFSWCRHACSTAIVADVHR